MQGNTSAWSAPPIDVDYRALPGDSQGESDNQRNNVNSSARQQRWQQVRSSETESTESHRQPYRQQADLQQVRRPTLAARQRQKVSIRPAGEPSLNKQRIVRQARPGQIGVNLNASGTPESRSNVVRALLVVFPFLRDWGGFL